MEIKKMFKNTQLKMNLQHFAEKEDTSNEETDTTEKTNDDNEQEETTFSQSDVDREVSKAVDKALKKRDSKHQKDVQQAIDDAIAEKERLSKLSEKERKDEEMTKREKDIADRLAEIERKELRADAVSDLSDKGLPADFADFLLADSAENTLNNINQFKETFDKAVNEAVKEKLRQDTPPAGNGGINTGKVPSVAEMAQEHRLIK